MLAKVKLLSKEVAELIAAGEVIERPCSIIKELVENSIDSGAKSVTVEIKHGGVTFMRVTDNGCGMSEEDVPTAFLRHATSKIADKDDLNKILTLGFRGEALASISAVSKVEMLTKSKNEQYGTHYLIEGTEEKSLEKSGCPDGTTIIIRDIFYNVPARLKFLKKDVTEGNAISSMISRIALSHPEISIKFIRDNKQELFTPGDGNLYSAVYSVFGKQFAASLIPVNYELNGIKVTGFTVKPIFGRPNRAFQHYFVNGRFVKSITCTVALEEAYKNSIMVGKFPACVLNLEIAPNIVDVNVHPAKIEVRFTNEKMIFDSVFFAVKNALMADTKPCEIEFSQPAKPKINYNAPIPEEIPEYKQMTIQPAVTNTVETVTEAVRTQTPVVTQKAYTAPVKQTEQMTEQEYKEPQKTVPEEIPIEILKPVENVQSSFKYINNNAFEKKPEIQPVVEEPVQQIPLKMIGEAFKNYLIAEYGNDVIFIDKHAAHERILFEKLKSGNSKLSAQMLLSPVEILLSCEEYNAVSDSIDMLTELGFVFNTEEQPFVTVSGIPSVLDGFAAEDIFIEIAKNLSENKNNPMPEILEDMYHTIACKSAIKANDNNSLYELEGLVKEVIADEKIRYCPHGRPVMFRLTKRELEKQFKRIQ